MVAHLYAIAHAGFIWYTGQTYGLANNGHDFADNCSVPVHEQVSVGANFVRLDGALGDNAVRHVFS